MSNSTLGRHLLNSARIVIVGASVLFGFATLVLIFNSAGQQAEWSLTAARISAALMVAAAFGNIFLQRGTDRRWAMAGALVSVLAAAGMMTFLGYLHAADVRARSCNHLVNIAMAMHNYESAHRHLPGSIRDPDGRPLLSVRVALLPFLEQDKLYAEFHLDEPWDSPHNLQLLEKIPRIYKSVGNQPSEPSHTFYRLVVGPGTAFEKERVTLKWLTEREGTANTVFWVEAGESVPWTKPEEYEIHPNHPLPPLGGIFTEDGWLARQRGQSDGTCIALGSGSVRFIPRDRSEQTWRTLLRRGGAGEYFSNFER